MLKIGHSITRPGRRSSDKAVTINVPEELEGAPGGAQNLQDVDFYSREQPLASQVVEYTAVSEYFWQSYTPETLAIRRTHDKLNRPIMDEARASGEIEPGADPVPGKDITQEIKAKARELGFGEVGITRFDRRYVYKTKKNWVKFPHAVCLAYEQDYEITQTAPSLKSEGYYGTYRVGGTTALRLAEYIRSLGYHAQVHSPTDDSGPYIPMFAEAGLGQLGANGQLLSPHFGSRARLMVITTDAVVTYDQPSRLRDPRLLQHLPGVREPLPWPRPDKGQGLVEGRTEAQGDIQALRPCHGEIRELCHMHEGLPDPEVRYGAGDGPLPSHRPGAGQGYPQSRGLLAA